MAEPFLAQIKIVAFNFAPPGWALCDGQQLPINQNQSLYSLLGTTYGGDGIGTFALPDLRARTPMHVNHQNFPGGAPNARGQKQGSDLVQLTEAQMPSHTHHMPDGQAASRSEGTLASPGDHLPAVSQVARYAESDASGSIGKSPSVGGGQAHQNMQPYAVLNFCIALQGIFPSEP